MLKKLKEDEYKQYLDFAYELALDMSRSCYPTYADGQKTREDFYQAAARAFSRENEELLLYEADGRALGLIEYYALPDDEYVQPNIFCVKEGMGAAVEKFIEYLRGLWPGSTLYFGLSETNSEAIGALKAHGLTLLEDSFAGVLRFEDYSPLPEPQPLVRITRDNFQSFARLHGQWGDQMYWNNARMLESLDDWNIYLMEKDGEPYGAIYFTYVDGSMEIFGVDFPEGRSDSEALRALLTRALNQSKADGLADLTFFHDAEDRPVVEGLGIRVIDRYLCYSGKI